MAWKNAKGGFVYWLNRLLNPDHPWTDYYDPTTDEMVSRSEQGTLRGDSASYGAGSLSSSSLFGTLGKGIEALINKWTDAAPTGGEIGRNEMQMQNAGDIYQRQVTGMQKAGVNPALMYQNGSPTPPSVSTSSTGSASMSDLMQLFMMPLQKRLLEAQAQQARDSGEAALISARAAAAGVPIKEGELEVRRGELGVKEYEAETARIRTDIERFVARTNARMTYKQIEKMASEIAYIDEMKSYISKNYDVAVQNADAHQKQALAALRSAAAAAKQAEAAVQNAATNDYLAGYQSDVLFSTQFLNGLLSKEKQLQIDFLPERYRAEIDEMRSRGYFFDQQGRLVDKTGKLVEAQTAETYTRMATEITHATCEIANTVVGLIPAPTPAKIGFPKN